MTDDDREEDDGDRSLKDELKEAREREERLQKEDRDQVAFEWCVSVRRAGEVYRETESVVEICNALQVDENTAREAIAVYLLVFEALPDDFNDGQIVASWKAVDTGIKFYRDRIDPEQLAERSDENDVIEYQERVCEFVGSLYRIRDPQDVEIVPPPELSTLKTPRELFRDQIRRAVSPSRVLQDIKRAHNRRIRNMISNVVANPAKQLADSISIQSTFRDALQTNIKHLLEPIRAHYEEVHTAIVSGVSSFEGPENYEPGDIAVDDRAEQVAIRATNELLRDIVEKDLADSFPYLEGIYYALEAYEDGEYRLPCYEFTFAQEGMMKLLCQELGKPPNKDPESPDYSKKEKIHAFAQAYNENSRGEYYGVECGDIIPELDAFSDHRNAIAHGDPNAVFDKNIATIAMLFLMLTLYTLVDYMDRSEDSEPSE